MLNHPYVLEKLMQLDAERVERIQHYERPVGSPRPNGVLLAVGRALRRAGEGMESWAAADGASSPAPSDLSCPDGKWY